MVGFGLVLVLLPIAVLHPKDSSDSQALTFRFQSFKAFVDEKLDCLKLQCKDVPFGKSKNVCAPRLRAAACQGQTSSQSISFDRLKKNFGRRLPRLRFKLLTDRYDVVNDWHCFYGLVLLL
jgi:hypothetical protein